MPGAETPTLPSMVVHYCKDWAIGWNRFWFSRTDTYVICVMRILTGWMLFYTHLVWSKDLLTFFSSGGVLPSKYIQAFHGHSAFAWSHFFWIESGWLGLSEATLIWLLHGIALSVFACFTLGLFTRMTAILSFLFSVSYANRAAGALFGLDQMNVYLAGDCPLWRGSISGQLVAAETGPGPGGTSFGMGQRNFAADASALVHHLFLRRYG